MEEWAAPDLPSPLIGSPKSRGRGKGGLLMTHMGNDGRRPNAEKIRTIIALAGETIRIIITLLK